MTPNQSNELIGCMRAIYPDAPPGPDVEAWLLQADAASGKRAVVSLLRSRGETPTAAALEAVLAECRDMDRLAADAWEGVARRVRMGSVQFAATGDIQAEGPIREQFDAALAVFVERTKRNMILGPWNEQAAIGNARLASVGIAPRFAVFAHGGGENGS